VGDEVAEVFLDVNDVDEVAVLIEAIAFELDFDGVVVRVFDVLCAPVSTDEEMLGDEITFDGDGVHRLWFSVSWCLGGESQV
jgi:hypothetical protein